MHASENPFVKVRPHPARDRGRRFTRREVLIALGGAGIACLTDRLTWAEDASGAVCITRPAQTEGPFFVEEALERSDIRSDPATGRRVDGTTLKLEFVVGALSNGRCAPLPGAKIDVWHCDASGRYSDVNNFGASTEGQKFLRGFQLADRDGVAAFTTIYPGSYAGRAVHIHFKIRTQLAAQLREFTSQIYFDDAFSDRIYAQGPYPAAQRRLRNAEDFLYRSGGARLTVEPQASSAGLTARFAIGLAA
jgi:protocatechuate 3,4-dioxygenase beta subunit